MTAVKASAATDGPEPGHRQPAPGDLAVVQAFVNTNDIEQADDQLRAPRALRAWLADRDVPGADRPISRAPWRRAIAVREGLRALAAANNGLPVDTEAIRGLETATAQLGLIPRLGVGSRWRLEPRADGIDGFLERVVAITLSAMADGSWARVKACQSDSCRWLFYDHSRNRSSTWCTMALCGARAKARAYRARKRPPAREKKEPR
jgi:predicted RNA-binding Zn ribbon-like protein